VSAIERIPLVAVWPRESVSLNTRRKLALALALSPFGVASRTLGFSSFVIVACASLSPALAQRRAFRRT
jgi:hypothetical protein